MHNNRTYMHAHKHRPVKHSMAHFEVAKASEGCAFFACATSLRTRRDQFTSSMQERVYYIYYSVYYHAGGD